MATTAPFRPMAGHAEPLRKPLVIPERKPMQRARRISLFQREVRVRLSAAAIDILFDTAGVLTEGLSDGGQYYGSTMITIDLRRASVYLSESCDIATAQDIEHLLAADDRVRERAQSLGLREAEQQAGCALDSAHVDVRVQRNGRHFHLDVDVEATTRAATEATAEATAEATTEGTP